MMECWSSHPSQRPTFSEMKDFFEGLLLQTCDTVSTFIIYKAYPILGGFRC